MPRIARIEIRGWPRRELLALRARRLGFYRAGGRVVGNPTSGGLLVRVEPKMAESLASGVEPGPDCSDRHMHDLGHLLVAELLHFSQNQSHPKLWSECLQQLFDNNPSLDLGPVARFHSVKFGWLGSLAAKSVHAQANADPIEEARKGSVVSKPVKLSERLQEGILGHIFGLKPIP